MIYFWLLWVFTATHGLSLVVDSGGYSSLQCAGFFSLLQFLSLQSTGCRHAGFSRCSRGLSSCCTLGLVAPRHVKSSWTRVCTHVSYRFLTTGPPERSYCIGFLFPQQLSSLARATITMWLKQQKSVVS